MSDVATMARPQRWAQPFGPDMTEADVQWLMGVPEIAAIQIEKFPKHTPLEGILQNDARLVRFNKGDIVIREGDYGNSAFLIIEGTLRVVLEPSLPEQLLGRQEHKSMSFFQSLSQLFTNSNKGELRDTQRYRAENLRQSDSSSGTGIQNVFLQDIPAVMSQHKTVPLGKGVIFGELAALGRIPRTASIFAEEDSLLLEIRWQGLRELRKFDPNWRNKIDQSYRKNALQTHLREVPLFADLDRPALDEIAKATLFETFGSFDWYGSYKQLRQKGEAVGVNKEPVIVKQGDYPDGLLLIRAGFARVSVKLSNGDRTLTYLGAGDVYGLDELYASWAGDSMVPCQTSLTALGYVDVLRVPMPVLEKHVFPRIQKPATNLIDLQSRQISDDALLEWAVEERFINATQAMLIDLDRCVRCDDCVRACSANHGGNPRFIRHGKTFDHWMVTNSCMHCTDPVCLIGCPTGAIHRNVAAGNVIINDDTCIACGTCANSCPFENIRLVDIRDIQGRLVLDPDSQKPIQKATKCDLCEGQLGGPACVRACPHDALRRVNFHDLPELRGSK